MYRILIISLSIFIGACSSVASKDRPSSYYQGNTNTKGIASDSLLGENDQKINELLYYQVKLPAKNRIAILKLSRDNQWQFYSNDFTTLTTSLIDGFISELRSSARVYDASFLPAMLVPDKRTVPSLREAAARFQADLLLAYRSSCNSYNKYRFMDPNETKAYCSVEAVLLDVRSGVITKSVVSTQDFVAVKQKDDVNFSETIKKAELEAVAKSLLDVAKGVNNYLLTVPTINN
ncbi:hypothetical protein KO525_14335 [Psychrosphaera sp. B3R10]|uniref:hypothetical protein n=1 Tax=unclassified Psychrosphaera TaxID=2641570 RepID=UPI001C092B88|nr:MULTISPECIES: hypothetical protein [unclassified Psychrosphaera]MBU2883343.1 hypothetical protein [Psychrosphaera sp. I2R16]MBU2990563.1 hypothetical protein [Psychrosphaera sp. B3R10]